MRQLDNRRWGFESNCFVCETRNERGLRIAFAHDEDRDLVSAQFCLSAEFSGAPTYAHGGIVLAIMDEAMAWAAVAIAGGFAVTTQTTARFMRPVRIGRTYTVEARVLDVAEDCIKADAVVVDDEGRQRASAEASFAPLGPAQAVDAIGSVVSPADAALLQPAAPGPSEVSRRLHTGESSASGAPTTWCLRLDTGSGGGLAGDQ